MEFSKSAERKYIWNFNNGSLKRQQRKISNSFTSFHHTAYLENITNNGNRRLPSTNQALPPIPYIVPKRITVLNSFINCSSTSCKANPNITPHKNIWKKLEKENLVKKTNPTREIAMENIPNAVFKQESNPNQDQTLRFQNISKTGSVPNFEKTALGAIEEKNTNSLGFHEKLKQNVLCGDIMKNLINQLTCAEQLFQNSHEINQKKIESKLVSEDDDKFKSNFSDDSERTGGEIINKPLISKKISNICKIFEKRESQETLPNSNYSNSNSSHHNQINVNWNSNHVDLSKLTGNSESAKIKQSACLKSAIIDKIKEKVFSASKDSNNNQNYTHHNNTLKFPKETSMAMKLLLNKRMLGLNENNKNDNSEKVLLHSQHKAKRKLILKSDPNLPCHKNLLCTKGNHSGTCDTRQASSIKVPKNCQASWLHSNNYYEGDLDLLNNCLNLTLQTN